MFPKIFVNINLTEQAFMTNGHTDTWTYKVYKGVPRIKIRKECKTIFMLCVREPHLQIVGKNQFLKLQTISHLCWRNFLLSSS